jgi:hypothetical protein
MTGTARISQITLLAVFCLALALVMAGCSSRRMMVRTAKTILPDALAAFNDEPDWELARVAGFSNLKLLETLHRGSPKDEEILVTLAQAFGGVALAFLEEDLEALHDADPRRFDEARRRAASFYARGQAYAAQALELRHPGLLGQMGGPADAWAQALERLSARDVPALFWYAFNQAGGLWLNRDDPASLLAVPLNRKLALRLVELDEGYFFGGPLLLLGISDAHLPAMLGGSLEQSARRFQRAFDLSGGRFLLVRVLYAQHCVAAERDRELFDRELMAVLDAPPDILPGYRLFTTLAQRRARLLAERADEMF